MRKILFLLAAVLLVAPAPSEAKRVALVVGNGAYEHAGTLLNPISDATAMAEKLEGLDFEVILGTDLPFSGMRQALGRFGRALKGADVGLIFFAGHGIQIDGQNYLVPVDADLQDETDVYVDLLQLNDMMRVMEASVDTRLVFVDACRDNPLARKLRRSMGSTRSTSVGEGLAKLDAAVGTLIAYATAPGSVAEDGSGANSPFSTALLNHIGTPGMEVRQVLTRVRADVIGATRGAQIPWDSSSLTGDFYFAEKEPEPEPEPEPEIIASAEPASVSASVSASAPAAVSAPVSSPAPAVTRNTGAVDSVIEIEVWKTAKELNTVAGYEAYKARFCPGGFFCGFADIGLAGLAQPQPQPQPQLQPQLQPQPQPEPQPQPQPEPLLRPEPVVQEQDALRPEPVLAARPTAPVAEPAEVPAPRIETPVTIIKAPAQAALQTEEPASLAAPQPFVAPTPADIESGLELTRGEWRDLQAALNVLGHKAGLVDGRPGRKTRNALADWQLASGSSGSGYLDSGQVRRLLGEAKLREAEIERERAAKAAETKVANIAPSSAPAAAPAKEEPRLVDTAAFFARGEPIEVLCGRGGGNWGDSGAANYKALNRWSAGTPSGDVAFGGVAAGAADRAWHGSASNYAAEATAIADGDLSVLLTHLKVSNASSFCRATTANGLQSRGTSAWKDWRYLAKNSKGVLDHESFTIEGFRLSTSLLRMGSGASAPYCVAFAGARRWDWIGGFICDPSLTSMDAVEGMLGRLRIAGVLG